MATPRTNPRREKLAESLIWLPASMMSRPLVPIRSRGPVVLPLYPGVDLHLGVDVSATTGAQPFDLDTLRTVALILRANSMASGGKDQRWDDGDFRCSFHSLWLAGLGRPALPAERPGSFNRRRLRAAVIRLCNVWCSIVHDATIRSEDARQAQELLPESTFRLVESVCLRKKHLPLASGEAGVEEVQYLERLVFARAFVHALVQRDLVKPLVHDVFVRLSSDVAAALYLYLPSAVHVRSESTPYRKSLVDLAAGLGIADANTPPSVRRRHFLRPDKGTDIAADLDGQPCLNGALRVRMDLREDGQDLLIAWLEPDEPALAADGAAEGEVSGTRSQLVALCTEHGMEMDAVLDRITRHGSEGNIPGHVREHLVTMGYDSERNRDFLRLARILALSHFDEAVAACRHAYLAGEIRGAVSAYVGAALRNAVITAAKRCVSSAGSATKLT